MHVLSQQCWLAAHGQSQGSPFPHPLLPCPETKKNKDNEYWACRSCCGALPVMEEAVKFSRYCRTVSTF